MNLFFFKNVKHIYDRNVQKKDDLVTLMTDKSSKPLDIAARPTNIPFCLMTTECRHHDAH